MTLIVPGVPAGLVWEHDPGAVELDGEGALSIAAGARTDLFADPGGGTPVDNAPSSLFEPPDARFMLSARVSATFASAFDAAALLFRADGDRWAKLAFEVSPELQPMVVSVVTRGVSDDCNGVLVDQPSVYLRLAVTERTIAFHSSADGMHWELARYFSLGEALAGVRVGFSAQSPTGDGCRATFAEVSYRAAELGELRDGTCECCELTERGSVLILRNDTRRRREVRHATSERSTDHALHP